MILIPKPRSASRNFWGVFKQSNFSGRISLILSSWFCSGLVPKASGTFGTLFAIPPAVALNYLGAVWACVTLIIFIPLAVGVSHISGKLLEKDDPSEVVIDEVAGFLITMVFQPLSWTSVILGFFLFRFFDILKPFPVGFVDKKVKGGTGIVLDDILAGLYANISLRIVLYFFGG